MKCKVENDLMQNIMKPAGKVIKNMLLSMQVKCPRPECGKVMTLEEYEEHALICELPKCSNVKSLHEMTTKRVKASYQARLLEIIEDKLNKSILLLVFFFLLVLQVQLKTNI